MRPDRALAFFAILLIGLAGCGARDATSDTQRGRPPKPAEVAVNVPAQETAALQSPAETAKYTASGELLSSFAVPPHEFHLIAAPCTESACPLLVQLYQEQRLLDTYPLEHGAPGQISSEKEDWATDLGLKSWSAYDPEGFLVATTARVAQLAPGVSGLLVSQRFGTEHMELDHVLLLARQGKLVPMWKLQPPQASEISVSAASLAPQGRPGFVVTKLTERHETGLQNTITASHAVWNATSQTVELQDLPKRDFPLYVLSAGVYSSMEEASAYQDNAQCVTGLETLDGTLYPSLQLAPMFKGYVFISRAAAEATQRTIGACGAKLKMAVFEYRGN